MWAVKYKLSVAIVWRVLSFRKPLESAASTTDAVQTVLKQERWNAVGLGGQQDKVSAFEEQY